MANKAKYWVPDENGSEYKEIHFVTDVNCVEGLEDNYVGGDKIEIIIGGNQPTAKSGKNILWINTSGE